MRKVLFISIGLLISVQITTGQNDQRENYWPLAVNNRWTYEHRMLLGDDIKIERIDLEVVSEEVKAGKKYFLLSNGLSIRQDGEGSIYEYNDRFDIEVKEFLIFNFSDLGEDVLTYRIPYAMYPPTIGGELLDQNHYLSLATRGRSQTPISLSIGTFHDTIVFGYGPSDFIRFIRFAKNVGLIQSGWVNDEGEFIEYELIEASINGLNLTIPTTIKMSTWGTIKQN